MDNCHGTVKIAIYIVSKTQATRQTTLQMLSTSGFPIIPIPFFGPNLGFQVEIDI